MGVMPRHTEQHAGTLPSGEAHRLLDARPSARPEWDRRQGQLTCDTCDRRVVVSRGCTYATHIEAPSGAPHAAAVTRQALRKHLAPILDAELLTVADLDRIHGLTITG